MTVNRYPLVWNRKELFCYTLEQLSQYLYIPVKPKLFWEVNFIAQGNCKEFVGFYLIFFSHSFVIIQ